MKNIPFHQYQRYELAKIYTESMRIDKSHKILEVGSGSHGNLQRFLPNDDILFMDSFLSEEAQNDDRFILDDAVTAKFEKDGYDFVIALDVIEHINKENRARFVENILNASKYGAFITFPHFTNETILLQDKYEYSFLSRNIEPPIWIEEHNTTRLPLVNEVYEHVKKIVDEKSIYRFYSVHCGIMDRLLQMESMLSANPNLEMKYNHFNKYYNNEIFTLDKLKSYHNAAKTCIAITKKDDKSALSARIDSFFIDDDAKLKEVYDMLSTETTQMVTANNSALNSIMNDTVAAKNNIDVLSSGTHSILNETSAIKDGINALGSNAHSLLVETSVIKDNVNVLNGDAHSILNETSSIKDSFNVLNNNVNDILNKTSVIKNSISSIYDEIEEFMAKPLRLDVLLVCYNQSEYIVETLNSVISQKTNFKFKIIVADDCSTDNTVELIKEIDDKTDIDFVYLDSQQNLGVLKNYQRAIKACTNEYIAIIEGDDIWSSVYKLQNSVDFLDSHYECSMVFNRFVLKEGDFYNPRVLPQIPGEKIVCSKYAYVTGNDLANENLIGNFSTSVYRTKYIQAIDDSFYEKKAYDWLLNILICDFGMIGCLIESMSIYRLHPNGVWSSKDEVDKLQSIISAIDDYNEYTNFKYNQDFINHRNRLQLSLDYIISRDAVNQVEQVEKSKKSTFIHIVKVAIFYITPPIIIKGIKKILPASIINKLRSK